MSSYETVIGLEVHVELSTKSKIFCACSTEFGGEANTHCCPVCTGMPGVLPILNGQVVEYAIRAGIATGCEITRHTKFDRKNYFYPDLPKAYQISQLYLPICQSGGLEIETSGGKKRISIREIHMEEDAGKLVHDPWEDCTLVDYNRCGVPLLEIVSQPDLRSAEEAVAYLEKLKLIMQYIGVSDCKMQEGSLRADLNISVRKMGEKELGVRTEMKNMNSFKAIGRAIEIESRRQIELLEDGGRVTQETRRWDDNKDASFTMRSKENAQDYRYFPDPDLVPIEIDDAWVDRVRTSLPELPEQKRARYQKEFDLPDYDIGIILSVKSFSDLFDATVLLGSAPKEVSNWILGDLSKSLNDTGADTDSLPISPEALAALIGLVDAGKINRSVAKKVFSAMFEDGAEPVSFVRENKLEMVNDEGAVAAVIASIVSNNPGPVEEYRSGKQKVYGFLVGQAMQALKGKADPAVINKLLKQALEG